MVNTTVSDEFRNTEVGPLPNEWDVKLVGDVCKVATGGTPSTKREEYFKNGEISWMKSGDIHTGFIYDVPGRITNLGLENSAAKLYPVDSVVIALSGRGKTRGTTAVLKIECTSSQSVAAMIPTRGRVSSDYLHYYLVSRYNQIRSLTGDRDRSGLNLGHIRSIPLALPPIDEQRRIARVLSTIQMAVEKQEAVIAAVRELKRSLMRRLFTYGPYAEPAETKETEIGWIPSRWKIALVGDNCELTAGGTPSRKNPDFWNGSIPWVKTSEINYRLITRTAEAITEEGLRNSSAKLFPPGTLLMAMYGQGVTRGRVAILGIEAATNQACVAFFPGRELAIRYLRAYFMCDYDRVRNYGHGANQKNLSAKIIKSIPMPVPPLSEQMDIACVVDSIDQRQNAEEKRASALRILFSSMLHELITGRIRVPEEAI